MTLPTRAWRALPWAFVLALLVPWGTPKDAPKSERGGEHADHGHAPANGTPIARLLGPIGSLAASVQWVRFDMALAEGRTERAYARAESALSLDPVSPEGWLTLGRHLITLRGSLESEPDAGRRARWIRAGLEVLERGEATSNAPGELALARGVYLAFFVHAILSADADARGFRRALANAGGWFAAFLFSSLPKGRGTLDWPGGSRAALTEACAAFERAAAAGHPQAALLLAEARALLTGLKD